VTLPDWLEPLHDAESMRSADAEAIEERGISSLELMEAAGAAVAEAVREIAEPGPVRIACGKGNNAGDGLVAARLLADTGFEVDTLLLWSAEELSDDSASNHERLATPGREVAPGEVASALAGSGCVVDAIFGTGFDGAPRSPAEEAIEAMNECGAPIVAADIASGVDGSTGEVEGVAARAAVTVTFHGAKLGHWIAPGKRSTGELRIADIGIPAGSGSGAQAGVIAAGVLDRLPRRGADSTKFTSGQVVVAGGSRGLTGSVVLSASAAIRAGAGYATVAVPAELEPIFEAKLTEVMSRSCASADGAFAAEAAREILAACEKAAALVLGPGFGRVDAALGVAREVAAQAELPLVLDADGLNAHEGALESLASRSDPTVITPHAGELARLLGRDSDEISAHRLASARDAAERGDCVVVLKGDDTIVAQPGGPVAVSAVSAPALATAGTGDVLAGTIGAFLAQGLDPFEAACAGVWANTQAGRIAAERIGAAESVIASDVIEALPEGLRRP
jgi:ADP-dependent NAD(P)H-hydrate dehydratase / NAD(P)H-hydrate epimerase